MKSGVTAKIKVAGVDSAAFVWKDDFLLGAFFHSTYDDTKQVTFDGKQWCSTYVKTVTNDGKASALRA